MDMHAPDLTKVPPRSPRVQLGGFVILPRMLDKGRATVAGTNGEYQFACPLDQRLLEFLGIEPEGLKTQLAAGKSDTEILRWVTENSKTKPRPEAIAAWSAAQSQRAPTDPESRQHFNELHAKVAPHRNDVATWFDLLDLDDFVSFGGAA